MTHLSRRLAILLLLPLSLASYSAIAAEDLSDAPGFAEASHTVAAGATIFLGSSAPDTEASPLTTDK